MAEPQSFERQVEAHARWNFVVNLLDITFIMFGLNLISQSTIMPLLVSELTPSKMAIGLIPAIYSLGYLLPQLLTANFAESLPRKKPFVMLLGGLGERVPYLLIGLLVWWLGRSAPVVTLVAFFLLLATSPR
jgi:MFS family permease